MAGNYVYVCCGQTPKEGHLARCLDPMYPAVDPDPNVDKETFGTPADDPVNHPSHYTSHPSGIECIQVTEHMGFCLGNAVKYIWRADLKADAIKDLKKAVWYIEREIARREGK